MSDSLVAKDLHVPLLAKPDERAAVLAEIQQRIAAIHAAVTATWPGTDWQWRHGHDTVPRVVAAIANRAASNESTAESSDAWYGPCGELVVRSSGHTVVWKLDVHATWRRPWHLTIEPRLRRNWWLFTSDRIPGTRELAPALARSLTEVMGRMLADCGPDARCVPGNSHWQRNEILVFP